MTDTDTTTTQAALDAAAYQAFLDNGQNKAAAARHLGVNASTVADRIKRHQARQAQDQAETDADRYEDPDDRATRIAEQRTAEDLAALRDDYASEDGEPEQAPVTEVTTENGARVTVIRPDAIQEFIGQVNVGRAAAEAAVAEEDAKVRAAGSVPNPNKDHAVEIKLAAQRRGAETAPAVEDEHDGHGHEAEAEAETAKPEKAERVTVTECVKCGFKFSRPQVRTTCQSAKACQRRQDEAKAAAA